VQVQVDPQTENFDLGERRGWFGLVIAWYRAV